ncbi:MAG: MBL fold metallo-hydrolase [Phycisphaeraceae bacterium]
MKLHFLGANRQVTGSRYVLEAAGKRFMIDCGMFQERPFRDRNWAPCPIEPRSLDALLLTHAHLDHCGLIPRLARDGFDGPIYTTAPSVDLARIIMEDSARIQQEDVQFKRRRHERQNRQPPHPYEPLYTVEDAQRAARLFHAVHYGEPLKLCDQVEVRYHDAGHILGSAMLEFRVKEAGGEKRLVFSGDLGLWNKPLIGDPTLLAQADVVVMESTYGDRDHDGAATIENQLADVINDTQRRGGNIIIPTFAVERAQELMFHLSRLLRAGLIPPMMVFLDSPMGVSATEVFRQHQQYLDEETRQLLVQHHSPFDFHGLVLARSREQSKAINQMRGTCIIMAGSGMATGGRIKHHLMHNISRPEATVVFVGYQGRGTLGREILEGGNPVRILGEPQVVRARIARIFGLSAHADRATLLRWLGHFQAAPKHLFLTHGDEDVALKLAGTIKDQFGWHAQVPEYGQVVELD